MKKALRVVWLISISFYSSPRLSFIIIVRHFRHILHMRCWNLMLNKTHLFGLNDVRLSLKTQLHLLLRLTKRVSTQLTVSSTKAFLKRMLLLSIFLRVFCFRLFFYPSKFSFRFLIVGFFSTESYSERS